MIDCYEDTFFCYNLTRNDFSLILRGQKHQNVFLLKFMHKSKYIFSLANIVTFFHFLSTVLVNQFSYQFCLTIHLFQRKQYVQKVFFQPLIRYLKLIIVLPKLHYMKFALLVQYNYILQDVIVFFYYNFMDLFYNNPGICKNHRNVNFENKTIQQFI